MHEYTIGTDAEVFFHNTQQAVPAIGLVGGTKKQPRPLGVGWVQEDNVAAEFNTPPVSTNDPDGENIWTEQIMEMLKQLNIIAATNGCILDFTPIRIFTPEQLSHPLAQYMGCSPDRNVYGIPPKNTRGLHHRRTIGAHIHIGGELVKKFRKEIIVALDYVFNSFIYSSHTQEILRARFYGGAGCYRSKRYGVEYRALSSRWLQSEAHIRNTWRRTIEALRLLEKWEVEGVPSSVLSLLDREELPSFNLLSRIAS